MNTDKLRQSLRYMLDIGLVNGWDTVADSAREALAELDKAKAEPVAWMTEDGRLAAPHAKSVMPSSADEAFTIPLFMNPAVTKALTDLELRLLNERAAQHRMHDGIPGADGCADEFGNGAEWCANYLMRKGYLAPSAGYHMSKDYEALYRLLCDGGEALGRATYLSAEQKAPMPIPCMMSFVKGLIVLSHEFGGRLFDNGEKTEFIAECQRLNLQWVAPGNGLNVEVVLDVVDSWMREHDENGDYFKRDNLRARLEAAAKAKQ